MVEYFLPPTEAGSRASRHGRPSFITHAAAQGSSTKKRGERPTSHAADALIWKGEDIRQAPPAPLALSSHTLKPRQDAPSPQGPSSLAACSFPPPLPSSVLLSPLCEPLQNAGGNDPSLAFCRQSALFFSSYHTEKEHSLSLARPMLKGSVPRPLPGGGPLPCAARAVRPGISNPMSGRLHDAPGGWRKALPAFGQGGPRDRMPGYPMGKGAPGLDARLSETGLPGLRCGMARRLAKRHGPRLRDRGGTPAPHAPEAVGNIDHHLYGGDYVYWNDPARIAHLRLHGGPDLSVRPALKESAPCSSSLPWRWPTASAISSTSFFPRNKNNGRTPCSLFCIPRWSLRFPSLSHGPSANWPRGACAIRRKKADSGTASTPSSSKSAGGRPRSGRTGNGTRWPCCFSMRSSLPWPFW